MMLTQRQVLCWPLGNRQVEQSYDKTDNYNYLERILTNVVMKISEPKKRLKIKAF